METRNKIRDALKEMTKFLKLWNDELNPLAVDTGESLISKAMAALNEPPRNCDVGTAEEQIERHELWCILSKPRPVCCKECEKCFARWAQMPYEKEEEK